MGRPPWCECDKAGVKKGPWTPEEDLTLVTYIHEHGAGRWRSVPANTGLQRCSKSCRLRWTNYLRPGIRRGNFSAREERVIVYLQSLLGNRWAAIASHLPRRTDNDIKNYWNTYLKKKLEEEKEKQPPQAAIVFAVPPPTPPAAAAAAGLVRHRRHDDVATSSSSPLSTADEVTQLFIAARQHSTSSSYSYSYPASVENISKLLKAGFMKGSPPAAAQDDIRPLLSLDHMSGSAALPPISGEPPTTTTTLMPQQVLTGQGHGGGFFHEPQQQLSSIVNWLFDEPKNI